MLHEFNNVVDVHSADLLESCNGLYYAKTETKKDVKDLVKQ